MVDLIDEAVSSGKPVDARTIGKLAFGRALAIAGLAADEKSWAQCGVATVPLALATVDVFGIMVAAAGISTTGAGAVIGVPVLLASAAFYAYQVNDVVEVCGEAYVQSAEARFAAGYNLQGKKSMLMNYSKQVCSMQ